MRRLAKTGHRSYIGDSGGAVDWSVSPSGNDSWWHAITRQEIEPVVTVTGMKRIPFDERKSEAERLGNGDTMQTPFKCPLCGNVATKQMFVDAGAEGHRVAVNCIGRVIGAKGGLNSRKNPVPQPCDWSAGGLFGTLGKGAIVVMEDGSEQEVFPFSQD